MSTFIEQSQDDRIIPLFDALGQQMMGPDFTKQDLVEAGDLRPHDPVHLFVSKYLPPVDKIRTLALAEMRGPMPFVDKFELPAPEQDLFPDSEVEAIMLHDIENKLAGREDFEATLRYEDEVQWDKQQLIKHILSLVTHAYDKEGHMIKDVDMDALRAQYASGIYEFTYLKISDVISYWSLILPGMEFSAFGNYSILGPKEMQAHYLSIIDPQANNTVSRELLSSPELTRYFLAFQIDRVVKSQLTALEKSMKDLWDFRENTYNLAALKFNRDIVKRGYNLIRHMITQSPEREIAVICEDYSEDHRGIHEYTMFFDDHLQLIFSWKEPRLNGRMDTYNLEVTWNETFGELHFTPVCYPTDILNGDVAMIEEYARGIAKQFFSGMSIVNRDLCHKAKRDFYAIADRRKRIVLAADTLGTYFQALAQYMPTNRMVYTLNEREQYPFRIGLGDIRSKVPPTPEN